MEGVRLLFQARVAGLHVQSRNGELIIKGPKRAEAVAQELLLHKAEVQAAIMEATEDSPLRFTCEGETSELAWRHGMWFFHRAPDAGWTCVSNESLETFGRKGEPARIDGEQT